MTGDVEEECSLLRISQHLGDPVSSEACLSERQPDSTAYINSNMAIENTCVFTAAIPADLAGNFPEGTVLQIMADSTIVAMAPVKELPTSVANTAIFKDTTFSNETVTSQNPLNIPTLLTESNDNNESQTVDSSICPEENISEIDLSFLNETVETSEISDPKCLSETATTSKELNGIISETLTPPIDLLQNSLNLPESNIKSNQELEQANTKLLNNETKNPSDNVVMIDVSKPIQLSQNSLIMVNGQKCVLQHDLQSGQVIAYPVKEQEKPRRRRGRPRKLSVEQNAKDAQQIEGIPLQEPESFSEDEREKGLLEVVNDDGNLVRRSLRKRRKAKVLSDYETGNLKQELGSDVDDTEILDLDADIYARKKKARGPGRPRKYAKLVETDGDNTINISQGTKRQRGRPRKIAPESEPTQAFLVQTADGQTLMMQVPLSSIPPGISLQQMAQEIANKLNFSLNQAHNTSPNIIKETGSIEVESITKDKPIENVLPQISEPTSEPVVQDHSIGSTTNLPTIQHLHSTDESSEGAVDSSCQNIINDIDPIIVESICESEVEVALENENCVKDVSSNLQSLIPENILDNQNNLNNLNVQQCADDNFCINVPSTASSSIDSNSILYNLVGNISDQFCDSKSNENALKQNIDVNESCKMLKDLFLKKNNLKSKINLQLLLQNNPDIGNEIQNLQNQLSDKSSISTNASGLILTINKDFNACYESELINQKICTEKEYVINQMHDNGSLPEASTENVFESEHENTRGTHNASNDPLQTEAESMENGVILQQNGFLCSQENSNLNNLSDELTSQFIKSEITCVENQTFEDILEKIPTTETSLSSDETVTVSSSQTLVQVPEKPVSLLIQSNPVEESKECKICQMPYFTNEELIEHFKSNHPKCICEVCNYMAEQACLIKRHSYRHTNSNCTCKICGKKYKDFYILKMHIKMVHLPPDVLYTCQICEKKFSRKAHLKRHLRIHAPVKQFQCPHCEYKGCEKSDITKHLLIHQEPKFKCEICGKAFRHLKNKDLHLKRHSGQRDYKCGICDHYGYTFTDIRKHIERRHSACCPRCGQIFKSVELLKEHKKNGPCQSNSIGEVIKIDENSNGPDESKESAVLDELPLELLDAEQPQIMCTISDCPEQTLSALQNGHVIMTSVEGILNGQNNQLIIEGLEDNLVSSDNLSVISMDKESNKLVTLVTSDGKNLSLPLKNCSLPLDSLECVSSSTENNNTEAFILPHT